MAKPKLCQGTLNMIGNRKRDSPTFEELYRAAKILKERKAAERERQRISRQEKEMEGVTFKPALVH